MRPFAVLAWVFVAGVLVVLMVIAGLMYATVREGRALVAPLEALSQPQPTPVTASRAVVLRQIRGASELTTAVFTMETVVTSTQDRRLGIFTVGETRLLYVAHGQVRAGVDLGDLTDEDVELTETGARVVLPPPTIQDRKIDVERSYVYDLDTSLLGRVDPELQSRAERFALERITAAACEEGILDQANDRAVIAVESLLAAAGSDDVVVEASPPAPDACPEPES